MGLLTIYCAQTILDLTHPAFKTIHFQSTTRTSPALFLSLPGTIMLTCLLTWGVRWIHNWTFSRRRNANVWDSLASASCLWNPQARTHTRSKSVRWIHNWTFSRRRNANAWDSLASASCLLNPQARTHTRCFPPGNKVQQVLAQCRSNIQCASNLSVPRPCRWLAMHPAAPWTWQLLGAPWGALTAPSTARWHLSRILCGTTRGT